MWYVVLMTCDFTKIELLDGGTKKKATHKFNLTA